MRYVLRFRHSDNALTPAFTLFRKVSDLSDLMPGPTIFPIANGSYYFDYIPTFDIHFEADGGASITDETIRYISDNLGPKDGYVDEPVSLVKDSVWDEPAISHVTPGTFGQTLQLADSGFAQAAASSTVTLRAGASAVTDFYKNGLIVITSGTGVGQSRSVTAYNGSTKVATVDRAWGTTPIGGDGYEVLPAAPSSSLTPTAIANAVWDEATTSHIVPGTFGQTLQLLTFGTSTAGGSSTITLAGGSSSIADFYKNALLVITGATGAGQARTITGYVGSTKVATVDRAWATNPDATSQYMVVPAAQVSGGGGGGGSGVSFTANGETVNPILISVASPKHTQVRITYSEAVVMTTGSNGALNLANYSIAGLTISAVESLTSQQVLLTTSPQTPNFVYTLVVTNVEDLFGNPIL